MGSTDTLTSAQREIYDYVSAHRDGASYLMAVESWTEASPYILTTGQEVMPMGGFSGTVPSPTLAKVQQLVSSGQLRFFLLSGVAASGSGAKSSSAADSRTGTSGAGAGGFAGLGARGGGSSAVTAIESWVKKTCTAVPAKDYGGTSSTSGVLYECKG
jgi:4-amino-4-deoxy-L-arabinose transferase-like glycosyltransferase